MNKLSPLEIGSAICRYLSIADNHTVHFMNCLPTINELVNKGAVSKVYEFEVGDIIASDKAVKNGLLLFFYATGYDVKHYSGKNFPYYKLSLNILLMYRIFDHMNKYTGLEYTELSKAQEALTHCSPGCYIEDQFGTRWDE